MQAYFSIKFVVWLKWFDARLSFQNLREDLFRNELSMSTVDKLWKPDLYFINGISKEAGLRIVKYDQDSSKIMLDAKNSNQISQLSQMDEAKVYYPNETEIVWRSDHFLSYTCKFDLQYFPFDQQTCFVRVRKFDSSL